MLGILKLSLPLILFSENSSCELITCQTLKLKLTVIKFSLGFLYQSVILKTQSKILVFSQLAYTSCDV